MAFEVRAIEVVDGGLTAIAVGHLDETEAPGAAGLAVGDQTDRLHGAVLLECLDQLVLVQIVREVTYVQIQYVLLFSIGGPIARAAFYSIGSTNHPHRVGACKREREGNGSGIVICHTYIRYVRSKGQH